MSDPEDIELANVDAELRRLDPDGARVARVLRRTYDQIYDGQHTGRFRWEQLSKTEKTHFGSLVEINLQREFSFKDGVNLDFSISGVDVDCKWSQNGQWMLPPEALNQICLLITGNDDDSVWNAGLVRAVDSILNPGANRDAKKTLNAAGRTAIHWICRHARLPENVLLHIDPAICKRVMTDLAGPRLGQKRLNELFRLVPHRIIGRGVVATVAQQDDYMKRVRDNGGSRGHLKAEGVVIFGDYQGHRELAERLGLPGIGDGDSMSARLKRIDGPYANAVLLNEIWYRLCLTNEEPSKPAPKLPKAKSRRT
jgi:hypothetical protein